MPLPSSAESISASRIAGNDNLQIDDAHDEGFDPPAEIGRARAERGAEDERHSSGRDADLDRDAQAVKDRREKIAALRVGAEDVHVAARPDKTRRAARVHQHETREIVRILRRDQRRQQRDERNHRHHDERPDRNAVLAELGPDARELLVHHALRKRRRGSSAA